MIWQLVAVAVWLISVLLLCWWASAAIRRRRQFEDQQLEELNDKRWDELESAKRRHPSARP